MYTVNHIHRSQNTTVSAFVCVSGRREEAAQCWNFQHSKLRLAQEDEDTHEVEAGLVFVVSVFWEVSPCFLVKSFVKDADFGSENLGWIAYQIYVIRPDTRSHIALENHGYMFDMLWYRLCLSVYVYVYIYIPLHVFIYYICTVYGLCMYLSIPCAYYAPSPKPIGSGWWTLWRCPKISSRSLKEVDDSGEVVGFTAVSGG